MSKIPTPPFQIWEAELGAWEVLFFVASEEIILFSVFFQIHFRIVYISPMHHSLDLKIWFMVRDLEVLGCRD